jgi:hypothetical protein
MQGALPFLPLGEGLVGDKGEEEFGEGRHAGDDGDRRHAALIGGHAPPELFRHTRERDQRALTPSRPVSRVL